MLTIVLVYGAFADALSWKGVVERSATPRRDRLRTQVHWQVRGPGDRGGVGHNLPQEAPQAFADAIIEVDTY
jgi:hypothetical protein